MEWNFPLTFGVECLTHQWGVECPSCLGGWNVSLALGVLVCGMPNPSVGWNTPLALGVGIYHSEGVGMRLLSIGWGWGFPK